MDRLGVVHAWFGHHLEAGNVVPPGVPVRKKSPHGNHLLPQRRIRPNRGTVAAVSSGERSPRGDRHPHMCFARGPVEDAVELVEALAREITERSIIA